MRPNPRLRTSFLALSLPACLSSFALVVSACGGAAAGQDETSTKSLSSALSFPVGVETSCSTALMQLSPGLEASYDWAPSVTPSAGSSLPTVTLTSSGGVISATINGTTSPTTPIRFTALSGASAAVVPGQSLTVPTSTLSLSGTPSTSANAVLPIEGGSITFTGDSFFLSLETSLGGASGTISAAVDCVAAGKAPIDCTCSAGEACSCAFLHRLPPLGVYGTRVLDRPRRGRDLRRDGGGQHDGHAREAERRAHDGARRGAQPGSPTVPSISRRRAMRPRRSPGGQSLAGQTVDSRSLHPRR